MLWIGRTHGIKNALVIIAGFAKVPTADILPFANESWAMGMTHMLAADEGQEVAGNDLVMKMQ